jgi:RecJ-like exonuclease
MFEFTVEVKHCSECHESQIKKFSFHFCDLKCFQKWLIKNKIFEKGIPCQDCRETGFLAGFKSNGKCSTCEGKARIKNIKMKGFHPELPDQLKKQRESIAKALQMHS